MKLPLFSVVECIAAARTPVAFSVIRDKTRIAPATLTRLLAKLVQADYVRKPEHGRYEAGPGLVALGTQVMENAAAFPFRAILEGLAKATGQNAELYTLTASGPMLLLTVPGRTEVRAAMPPGSLVKNVFTHPAGLFHFNRFPEAYKWMAVPIRLRNINVPELRTRVTRAVADGFAVDRGGTRPELACAAVPTSDGAFCVCVSGGISDFPARGDARLRLVMHRVLKQFKAAGAAPGS